MLLIDYTQSNIKKQDYRSVYNIVLDILPNFNEKIGDARSSQQLKIMNRVLELINTTLEVAADKDDRLKLIDMIDKINQQVEAMKIIAGHSDKIKIDRASANLGYKAQTSFEIKK